MTTTDKPTAFKNWINRPLLERISKEIGHVYPQFQRESFLKIDRSLNSLELKERVRLVRDALKKHLPQNYETALKILIQSTQSGALTGFDLWPYTDFVQTYGLNHVGTSLEALKHLTKIFTSEFAVRPFITAHPQATFSFLLACSKDPNVHVRRWASEGSRPRLPWGEKIAQLIKDPRPTLKILDRLKNDDELYVRKSVANHLNDIAKDHPDYVLQLLKHWGRQAKSADQEKIEWITRRALRNLIKAGHPKALTLLGVKQNAKVQVRQLKLNKSFFVLNENLEFSFELKSLDQKPQKIVIDYVIHHVKANKQRSPKVFKLKTIHLESLDCVPVRKKHSLKKITTRKYYSGVHLLEIQVNGKILAQKKWTLHSHQSPQK